MPHITVVYRYVYEIIMGIHGREPMVAGFTTTYAFSVYHH